MDINQIVNTTAGVLSGGLTFWLLNAMKRDSERKKKKK